MEKRVRIPEQVSTYVEKLFFEYNASVNILRYLMSQDDVKDEYIQRYSKSAKEKYIELETAERSQRSMLLLNLVDIIITLILTIVL